jgi:hypothetical protein
MWNKWKAALIAVFNDETTLTAQMGDWLHMQNHQESEWLIVQDKCIYRHNSGEWSQFSQLNLGILRFSTTPRIVPQPNGFSHRIQVTQRTHYHEVVAKVNIICRSNVGPTHIHNYISGIGLSFLALPIHIQLLTGDIPALPTPTQFYFDEPVNLIIDTDGSLLFVVGYHGWVLSTKEETILLRGRGPDDGIQSLMTSYRSELGGLVAGLSVLGTLFRSGTMNIRSIRFIYDNESAVTAARRPKSESIFHNTRCDWNIIAMIQDLIVRWCKGVAIIFHWVKGHIDRIDRPLTRDERLNIEADIQANAIRAQARGTIVARPNCPHWDIEAASLFIQVSKVTSDMKNQLTSQMHDDNLRSFLMQKESWSTQIFDAIDWNSSERALRRLSKNRQMNVVTLCHNYWHTGSIHVRFYGGERPCCFFHETKYDWRHILNCLSLDASYHRDASWQKVKKDMQIWRLPADFWVAIEKGLNHLPSDLK